MNTSQYMDKQIMDLSNSHGSNNNNNNSKDFVNLINPQEHSKEEEIMPTYDFQPIRLRPTPTPPSSSDSGNGGARDSKVNSISRMKEEQSVHGSDEEIDDPPEVDSDENGHELQEENYGSLESTEPAKVIFEKDRNIYDAALLSEIDQTMKKHADNLLHALVGVSSRLSQLESRTRHLENSVDDLKESVGNNHGSTDGKMRQLENILREVKTGVQVVRDKQETLEAQLQLANLQVSKGEQQSEIQSTMHMDPVQQASSAPLQSHHQLPPIALTQPPPIYPPPIAPLLPQQNQLPYQYSQNQIPPSPQPQHESYFPPSGQTPENPNLQYQLPLQQQLQPQPPSPPQQQFQPSPLPQYSQPPPPAQPHASLSAVNAPQSQPQPPPLGHHPEETPYIPSQNFPPRTHQPPSHPPSGAAPSHQLYGTPSHMYESSSSIPGPGFSPAYGPSSVPSEPYPSGGSASQYGRGSPEPYPYGGSASQYGRGSPVKSQQPSSLSIGQSGGSAYPQLPTARILPHGLRTASGVDGGSSSAGTGNKVPIDDVVERMTNMGFPRDHVRATVRRLTDNGQSVDLNMVLDKLMNDGEVQPPRGWLNR